jgi:hypothetical protein
MQMAEVSIGARTVTCGKCGSAVIVHKNDDEPKPDDRVVCPIHGAIGTYGDVSAEAFAQISKSIGPALRKALGTRACCTITGWNKSVQHMAGKPVSGRYMTRVCITARDCATGSIAVSI